MSPDNPESDNLIPVVLRQRDLVRALGSDIAGLLGEVDDHAVVECRLLAGYGQFTSRVVRIDGSSESVPTPETVSDALRELREKIMYSPAGGTWMSARFVVHHGGGVDGDFNYDTEPDWSYELDPVLYAQELRAFPRDERSVPGWLRRKVDSISGGVES